MRWCIHPMQLAGIILARGTALPVPAEQRAGLYYTFARVL